MNAYIELNNKQQKEFNDFPIGFFYDDEQFNKMMANLGLEPSETDKICPIGYNGYIRKSDKEAFLEMIDRHAKEIETARKENKDDYLYHMFNYELANHEYSYTGELEDTLDALGLTLEEIYADKEMLRALNRAMKNQQDCDW